MVRVMVLWGLGINCEEETKKAYELAGASVSLVHINEFLNEKYSLDEYKILHLPGGFSFGDHLGAGRVLANRLRYKKSSRGLSFRDEILSFTQRGGFVFGICNGFQILVSLGLLPLLSESEEACVSLIQNQSGNFQDYWVRCRVHAESPIGKLWPCEYLDLPIRHGEGRLYMKNESIGDELKKQNLIAMTYADSNPNGSFESCAALCDASGRILGMMPHPEAFLSKYNHPEWSRHLQKAEKGDGLLFFENLVKYVEQI